MKCFFTNAGVPLGSLAARAARVNAGKRRASTANDRTCIVEEEQEEEEE